MMRSTPPHHTTSMGNDLLRGNRLELPWCDGKVVELGRRHGIPTPVNGLNPGRNIILPNLRVSNSGGRVLSKTSRSSLGPPTGALSDILSVFFTFVRHENPSRSR